MSKGFLEKEFEREIRKYADKNFKIVQESLAETAEEFKKTLESATPVGNTGKFRGNWKQKKYPNTVYLYNGPMTNIAEYSRRGPAPFIHSLFESNKESVRKSLIKNIEQKIRRN